MIRDGKAVLDLCSGEVITSQKKVIILLIDIEGVTPAVKGRIS
jgi:hypothetical protein